MTSLDSERVTPEKLLEFNRRHWEIENRVHYVRDVTYDEDRSRVRTQNGPRVMASLRNLVISIFRILGFMYIPSAIRFFTFSRYMEYLYCILGI